MRREGKHSTKVITLNKTEGIKKIGRSRKGGWIPLREIRRL